MVGVKPYRFWLFHRFSLVSMLCLIREMLYNLPSGQVNPFPPSFESHGPGSELIGSGSSIHNNYIGKGQSCPLAVWGKWLLEPNWADNGVSGMGCNSSSSLPSPFPALKRARLYHSLLLNRSCVWIRCLQHQWRVLWPLSHSTFSYACISFNICTCMTMVSFIIWCSLQYKL